MGAKTWMLVYADSDPSKHLRSATKLDQDRSIALAKLLLNKDQLELISSRSNLTYTCPGDNEVVVGAFPNVEVVAASEFGIDYPCRLPKHFLDNAPHRNVYLHAMHSAVDWLAFAHWSDGKLIRSLSLSPDSGVLEEIG